MKKLLLAFGAFITCSTFAQTVSVPIVDTVYGFTDHDSVYIDIDGDLTDDILVAHITGWDNYSYFHIAQDPNLQVAGAVTAGQSFAWWGSQAVATSSTIGCYGWSWAPNTGLRYEGFYRVNSPSDTTFGYVTMDFRGDAECHDTLFIYSATRNTVSNDHLLAGEVSTASISENNADRLHLFPNPATEQVTISGSIRGTAHITDMTGRRMSDLRLSEAETELDLSSWPAGTYFISVEDEISGVTEVRKLIVRYEP